MKKAIYNNYIVQCSRENINNFVYCWRYGYDYSYTLIGLVIVIMSGISDFLKSAFQNWFRTKTK